jgi:hypothetical protein
MSAPPALPRRKVLVSVAFVVAIAATALVWVALAATTPATRLVVSTDHWTGISSPPIAPGVPSTDGIGGLVCVEGPGTVTIDSMTPIDSTGGFTVTAFALRPSPTARGLKKDGYPPNFFGHSDKLIDQVPGFGEGGHTATIECGSDDLGHEIGWTMHKTEDVDAISRGFLLHYTASDGDSGSVLVPQMWMLCKRKFCGDSVVLP